MQAFSLILLTGASIFAGVNAASLVATGAENFDRQTLEPPGASQGHLVFNWHDDDSGDHNAVNTALYMLTEGGNASVTDNSTGQYVIEALAVQFNKSHFTQDASTTPWVAIFSCSRDDVNKTGNTTELISNAERLGASAILAYSTDGCVYQFCSLTDNNPPARIPIYTTENWHDASLVFNDEIDGLFRPTSLKYYTAKTMNQPTLLSSLNSDFDSLRTNSSFLTQTDALLIRIPAVQSKTSAAAAAARAAEESRSASLHAKPTGTPAPGSGARTLGLDLGMGWSNDPDALPTHPQTYQQFTTPQLQ
ncbi:hypothetical protein R3P38DRAFT_3177416 [Favolaschia claudopus]|uniref:Uncharacterized protein n=1 Tax=Favolaschia claudopus TaxID=2862362 RepID=A0AAW0D2U1_9AGAR